MKDYIMRCAAGCGVVVKTKGTLQSLQEDCVRSGNFKKIGKLYFCPKCANKKEAANA